MVSHQRLRTTWLHLATLASAMVAGPTPPSVASEVVNTAPPPAGRVLAEANGNQGIIRVEEREGRRVLTIDGVVQGAARPASSDGKIQDPLVGLIAGLATPPRKALLVGLGTGATASDLQLVPGLVSLDVVELEPAVVSFARKFFDYRGPATVADGLVALRASPSAYDVVVLDIAITSGVPAPLADIERVRVWRSAIKLSAQGVLVLRLVGMPHEPAVRAMVGAITTEHGTLFGSGIAEERQNLYLFASTEPLLFTKLNGVAAWPLLHPEPRGGSPIRGMLPQVETTETLLGSRRVRLSGYLVRLRENGALALDLAHGEMGAMRFLLKGPLVASLESRLTGRESFPTAGDLLTDGDLDNTMVDFVGQGGVKGSEIRYSRVAASVEGVARLYQVIDPSIALHSSQNPDKYPKPELLPWGGSLFELEVTKVVGTVDQRAGARAMRLVLPLFRRAARRLEQGDLLGASHALFAAADRFSRLLGPATGTVALPRRTRELASTLRLAGVSDGNSTAKGEACRRIQETREADVAGFWAGSLPGLEEIGRALRFCAGDLSAKRVKPAR